MGFLMPVLNEKMDTNDIVITLPPSKSLSNRWLVVNYLRNGIFQLKHLSDSSDTHLLKQMLQQLRRGSSSPFYCGNAGSAARFMMALLAVTPGTHRLYGDKRMEERPMGDLVDSLRGMGLSIRYLGTDGHLPVEIVGASPRRKMAFVNPSVSSQYVSALMLVAPAMPDGMTLTMTGRPTSKPYIEMTRNVLETVGVEVGLSKNGRVYRIAPFSSRAAVKAVTIENDWSAASYFYFVAALLGGKRLRLRGLSLDSCQGDRVVAEMFSQLGVVTTEVRSPYRRSSRSLTIAAKGKVEKKVRFNFIDCPDLLPTVAVACAALGVDARMKGIKNLRYKESDRVSSVSTELAKMGCRIEVSDDEIHVLPSTLYPVVPVSTYGDHRLAMAFAPLMVLFPEMVIEDQGVVEKSFPDFWSQLQNCVSAK